MGLRYKFVESILIFLEGPKKEEEIIENFFSKACAQEIITERFLINF